MVDSMSAVKLCRRIGTGTLLAAVWTSTAWSQPKPAPDRAVIDGITTKRVVPAAPYDLAGKRIVFTNWHYVQPGDLDWQDSQGKSVYVKGDEGPFAAQHVGMNAPHGIGIRAEKPQIVGPFERPHRMILRDGKTYKGWTDSDYYESKDAIHWEKKAALKLGAATPDGFYQVFIDTSASANERYKAIWVGQINRQEFDAFRARRPDGWEPRALLHLGEQGIAACLRGGTSPDGIHWTTLPDPIVVEYCDTWNTAYFDPLTREYVIYTRQWSLGPRTDRLPPDIRNSWTGVGRRASDELRHTIFAGLNHPK